MTGMNEEVLMAAVATGVLLVALVGWLRAWVLAWRIDRMTVQDLELRTDNLFLRQAWESALAKLTVQHVLNARLGQRIHGQRKAMARLRAANKGTAAVAPDLQKIAEEIRGAAEVLASFGHPDTDDIAVAVGGGGGAAAK